MAQQEPRGKAIWTPEEDELLLEAVRVHGGKNWKAISEVLKNKSCMQCLGRYSKVLQSTVSKGSWTAEEDSKIRELATEHGPNDWSEIAQHLPGRMVKECKDRWLKHLSPSANSDCWTMEEDRYILTQHAIEGLTWVEIAMTMPGRTESSTKNRWNLYLKGCMEKYLSFVGRPSTRRTGNESLITIEDVDAILKFIQTGACNSETSVDGLSCVEEALELSQSRCDSGGETNEDTVITSDEHIPVGLETSSLFSILGYMQAPTQAPTPAPEKCEPFLQHQLLEPLTNHDRKTRRSTPAPAETNPRRKRPKHDEEAQEDLTNQVSAQMAGLVHQKHELERKLSENKDRIESLESQVSELQAEKASLEKQTAEFSALLRSDVIQKMALANTLLHSEVHRLTAQLVDKTERLKETETRLRDKDTRLVQLQQGLSSIQDTFATSMCSLKAKFDDVRLKCSRPLP